MKKYPEYNEKDSGQSIPYNTFSTSSAIMWATSSSDPLSLVEFYSIPVEFSDELIINDHDYNTTQQMFQKITKKGKRIADWINAKTQGYDLTNFEAPLAMIASEESLEKIWNSPEEDDAWAHL